MTIRHTAQFLLDREPNRPDAKLRFRIKWNHNKSIVAFNVGYRVEHAKWSVETQRCVNNTTHGKRKTPAKIINAEIQRFEQAAADTFAFFEQAKANPSEEDYRIEFVRRIGRIAATSGKTFSETFDDFMKDSAMLNSWSEGTKKRYAVLRNKILRYNANISLETLAKDDLAEFVQSMFREKLHNTTVAKKISDFKTFLRWAAKNRRYGGDLHDTFSIRLKGTEIINEPIYLKWEELMHLYSFRIPEKNRHLEKIRDALCFMCFTSLRYSDVANLSHSDVKDNHIVVVTQKTTEGIKIELNKYSRAILEKYRNAETKGDKVLPVISNQRMNEYIKKLAELIGQQTTPNNQHNPPCGGLNQGLFPFPSHYLTYKLRHVGN